MPRQVNWEIRYKIATLLRAGYTQSQVSRRLGVSRQRVSQLVRGRAKPEAGWTFIRDGDIGHVACLLLWQGRSRRWIAKYCGCSVTYLYYTYVTKLDLDTPYRRGKRGRRKYHGKGKEKV